MRIDLAQRFLDSPVKQSLILDSGSNLFQYYSLREPDCVQTTIKLQCFDMHEDNPIECINSCFVVVPVHLFFPWCQDFDLCNHSTF